MQKWHYPNFSFLKTDDGGIFLENINKNVPVYVSL